MTGKAWCATLVILGAVLFVAPLEISGGAAYAAGAATPAATPAKVPVISPTSESTGADGRGPSEESPVPEGVSPSPAEKGKTADEGVWLDESQGISSRDREQRGSFMKRIWLTVFSLIIVSIIIYIMLKFVYSRQGILPGLGSRNKMIRVVERHILQPSKALYLLDVAGKYVLIGISEQRIEYLMELDGERFKEEAPQPEETAAPQGTFQGQLMSLLGQWQQEKKK
jgi:flagellar protein FliO/FliZ